MNTLVKDRYGSAAETNDTPKADAREAGVEGEADAAFRRELLVMSGKYLPLLPKHRYSLALFSSSAQISRTQSRICNDSSQRSDSSSWLASVIA